MRHLFEGRKSYGASDIIHLNNIINLSALTDEYTKTLPVIRQILLQDQEIPMMYYFLIKIYSMAADSPLCSISGQWTGKIFRWGYMFQSAGYSYISDRADCDG